MKKLTARAFQQAKAFLVDQGRTLEQSLFGVYFGEKPQTAVLTALAAYQNDDGGFGRALEPDLRASASSAVATQQAFIALRAIGATSHEPPVPSAVNYLLHTYDSKRSVWPIISPEIEQAPHAPWWNYADAAQNFGNFLANPRAALVGYLHDHRELVPPEFLAQVTDAVVTALEASPEKMEMHDLQCYVSLAETASLPQAMKSRIQEKLLSIVPASLEFDPEKWTGYGLPPLGVVKAPDHFLAAIIPPQTLAANLDFLVDQQQSDGAWAPAWNWAFIDEAAWQAAEREWKSQITLNNLKLLHAFGRIESALA